MAREDGTVISVVYVAEELKLRSFLFVPSGGWSC
jgi:hypothetical protein